jgi:hypothetical protein
VYDADEILAIFLCFFFFFTQDSAIGIFNILVEDGRHVVAALLHPSESLRADFENLVHDDVKEKQ